MGDFINFLKQNVLAILIALIATIISLAALLIIFFKKWILKRRENKELMQKVSEDEVQEYKNEYEKLTRENQQLMAQNETIYKAKEALEKKLRH